ncbi:ABC transporter substrate-binding protein [Nocardiopsis suaedae]|uniref:ABC transporter substrate-binding protein n=1 Tax=Nocardiopsis suaedae TaxID=3018444 RepID=A0ABT4TH06_9ACTN|nr:ABC transporter substrate-binding protein [Nocardiopsis suaedae]MDA2803866.1 ABC transporter substrate-binding protein [Nocardiopsis suaedae]
MDSSRLRVRGAGGRGAGAGRGPALTRRGALLGMGGLAALGAAGCGGGNGRGSADGPVRTIEHKYGTAEISGTPERIVTVGLTEQDYVLALNVAPVGVREWFGEHPGALWPWAKEALGDADLPEVLPVDELDFEQIGALAPDLVLGVNSGLTQDEYDTLDGIAPTIAQHPDHPDFGVPWQEIARVVGTALDREDDAEALIADIEERFKDARDDHPEFAGATALLASSIDGAAWAYAEGPAPGFLTQLGMGMPEQAEALFTDEERAPKEVSLEELELLEADALLVGVYGDPEASITGMDVFKELDSAKEGRVLEMPEMSRLNGALSFGSVLSLHYALDVLPDALAALLDGDPDTEPDEAE